MNLKKLFDMQKKLDEKILERFPHLRNEDLLPQKILALQVELGELCNCWRGFKYWSNDQKPRTEVPVKYYSGGPTEVENWLLEEYVDAEHFFISTAIDLGIKPDEFYTYDWELEGETYDIFLEIMYHVSATRFAKDIELKKQLLRIAHGMFLSLGVQRLGFTHKQIEQAYMAKNAENHRRQESGY